MHEGQDRSGEQPPEYLGAWSPITPGDEAEEPGDSPAAGTTSDPAPGPVPSRPDPWTVPAPGEPSRDSATQPGGLAQLGFGPDDPDQTQGTQTPGSPTPGSAAPGSQPPGSFGQPGYGQPGYAQPGSAQPGSDQPGYGPAQGGRPDSTGPGDGRPVYGPAAGQPGYGPAPGQPGPGQPDAGPAGYGQPGYQQPSYGQTGYTQPTAAFGQSAPPGGQPEPGEGGQPGHGQPGQGGQPGGYPGGYGQSGSYPGGYGQPGHGQPGPGLWGSGSGGAGGWAGDDVLGYGSQEPPGRRRGGRALVYIVVAALAAGVGAGTVVALNHGSQSPGTVSSSQIPSPHGNAAGGANTTTLNVQDVANKVQPGIVDVNSELKYQNGAAAGTGMVLSPNGLVLTNNHVVEGSTHLTATVVNSGHRYQAKVLGVDPKDDVALIKLTGASELKTVQVGDSSKVTLGTAVVALGNAGGNGGSPTVTSGSITALNRTITANDAGNSQPTETLRGMLQTNAAIAEGDSGGPLANGAGQVIGMNTAADSQQLGGPGTNMGFAIPINRALSIAKKVAAGQGSADILIGSKVSSGIMGVNVAAISEASRCLAQMNFNYSPPTNSGALVCSAFPGDPAARAGVKAGDVITAVNGQTVSSDNQLTGTMRQYGPGDMVSVTWVSKNGQRHTSSLTLANGPIK